MQSTHCMQALNLVHQSPNNGHYVVSSLWKAVWLRPLDGANDTFTHIWEYSYRIHYYMWNYWVKEYMHFHL